MTARLTFRQRMAVAISHEQAVDQELQRRGWEVFDFGQATLPFQMFAHLHVLPVAIRWRPDRIARRPGTQMAALVDAKGTTERNRESANHAIECDSLSSLVGHADANGLECYVVFHDFKVATAHALAAIVERGDVGSGQGGGLGSGTPYWLIPRRYIHDDLDSVFGWPL